MPERIQIHQEQGVLTVTLNRPDKRNAIDSVMVSELKDALADDARHEDVRVVVLTGGGSVFSAGADLAAMKELRDASLMENRDDSAHLAGLFEAIYTHEKPVIGKVNGHAIAGGCGLAAVCDLSFVAKGSKLGFTETRIGFVPAIVMVYVRRKLGEAALRDLLLRGRLIEAHDAATMGLVNEVVSPDNLDDVVADVAEEIATETSRSGVALTKEMLAQVPGMGRAEALDYAIQMNAFARGTDDCKAGIQAFLDKEPPPWKK
ncbi:methylglutaconyl-CoA hydratase [Longibacter salinarum]|uniref:Methylglutaconyl-CoA hydratase n=1 Tax=Longibacter salinarum TaxID=1850348 RepID=A0A2A8D319_9BACT|nr:enoyl-CoA hydratase-related protein [Longibacter salinarum]PEN15038.1 methylglutaconyl-CoA hydratase [Longibacter salinarum]